MKNAAGRDIPEYIEGYGAVRPYAGLARPAADVELARPVTRRRAEGGKLLPSITEAIKKTGLSDGMTVSFHHHLRNGDKVLNQVMAAIAELGIRDIHVAASGIFPCHEPLVPLIESGVVTKITTSTFNPGAVPKAISRGAMKYPCVLMSHGGRPRAIERGELHIDVAFIAAPSCDREGNLNGTHGKSACGYLSYAYADARYADKVVAITDDLAPYPNMPVEISQDFVDYVVQVESIGDPSGIVSGTTQITTDPVRLRIADNTAELMERAGYIKEGMSFQTGASSIALAVAANVRARMLEKGVTGSFGLGGIHAYFVRMLEEGLFRALMDVQCFDLDAVKSAAADPRHLAISGSWYANPDCKGTVVDMLDTVILGATEMDVDYNVNVVSGSNGVIMGASGGHSDCAAGAKLTIVVSNLMKKTRSLIKERVTTITTPGETVDALVTEYGVAINPRRTDLLSALEGSGVPLITIEALRQKGLELGAVEDDLKTTDRVVGVVEYRDGTVIDVVRCLA